MLGGVRSARGAVDDGDPADPVLAADGAGGGACAQEIYDKGAGL